MSEQNRARLVYLTGALLVTSFGLGIAAACTKYSYGSQTGNRLRVESLADITPRPLETNVPIAVPEAGVLIGIIATVFAAISLYLSDGHIVNIPSCESRISPRVQSLLLSALLVVPIGIAIDAVYNPDFLTPYDAGRVADTNMWRANFVGVVCIVAAVLNAGILRVSAKDLDMSMSLLEMPLSGMLSTGTSGASGFDFSYAKL